MLTAYLIQKCNIVCICIIVSTFAHGSVWYFLTVTLWVKLKLILLFGNE